VVEALVGVWGVVTVAVGWMVFSGLKFLVRDDI